MRMINEYKHEEDRKVRLKIEGSIEKKHEDNFYKDLKNLISGHDLIVVFKDGSTL